MNHSLNFYLDGEWVESLSGERFAVRDPSTEDVLGDVPRANAADVDRAVESAHRAFRGAWRRTKPVERGRALQRFARLIEDRLEDLARLESLNTGKPISVARGEVRRAARYFEYYAGAADKLAGEVIPEGGDYLAYTTYEPVGVTGHILPWNVPLVVLARSVAPALAAGCTVVVKPAEQTPLTALLAAELGVEAGLPPGALNVISGYGDAGAALVAHPKISLVAFTGSVEVGRAILRVAAERIIPVYPELGGKSPNIVFADADLDSAVENAYRAMFANAGQNCQAGSRLLVERAISQEFLARLCRRIEGIRLGAGLDDPDMGPLISGEQQRRVLDYIDIGRKEGARIVTGGGRPASLAKGYFVAPTIFDRVDPQMRIAREEIFGPVLSVFPFETEDEAIALANDTEYGLAAGVFTRDISRALRLAREIEAGRVHINEYPSGDVSNPFGGYKLSGFGRIGGMESIAHFSQVKNVIVRT